MVKGLVCGLVLAVVAVACRVPPAVPALPSKGGPRWVEVSSAHFTIWTDAPERGHDLVRSMERLREVIYGTTLFGKHDEGYRILVIAFANKEEVGAYVPPQFSAYASGVGALFQPVIVVAADALETIDTRRIFTHELAHVISYGPLPHQPSWFSEALASFYETAEVDGLQVDLGKPTRRAEQLRHEHPMPLAALFACKDHACMTSLFYATAWALFTFLATEHADELFAFMAMLSSAPEGTEDQLWAKAFPSLASPDAAEHAFLSWIAHGKVLVRQYTVKSGSYPSTERPLADADALTARGVAQFLFHRDALPKDITDALALDPTNITALMIDGRVREHLPIETARAATTAHPDDWRAWYLLRRATIDGTEQRTAQTKMCELVARNAVALPTGFCR